MTTPSIKGVILAAGYGSRFLPVTKTIPKEMLPLVDVPAIQLIVDEFQESGITDILIITSRRKKSLEDYFDREMELEWTFSREGATRKLDRIRPARANIFFVRQQSMSGTAHALAQCRPFTGDSPFIVAYPDDIMFSHPPCSRQLIDAWHDSISPEYPAGCSILSVLDATGEDVSRYGVVDPEPSEGLVKVRRMVEKPPPGTEPSHLISLGRYLYTPELFSVLDDQLNRPRDGEYYQTEPINELASMGKVACSIFNGDRYDTGEPLGYLQAIVRYALTRKDLREPFQKFLDQINPGRN